MTEKKEQEKDEFEFKGTYHKKYENIKNLLQSAINQVEKVKNAVENLEQEERKSHYQNIPGTEGVFDGQYLVAEDGRKTEVPANYAAKSKLVYGDILKVFTDSGKQIFKQIDRVDRKKIEGIMTKKEGKWYLLSDLGSYKVSDVSADYNKAELNDKAFAFIPAENPKVPFAALDYVFKEESNSKDRKTVREESSKKPKAPARKKPEKNSPEKKNKDESKTGNPKKTDTKKAERNTKKDTKKPLPESETKKEFVENIMDDDDLR
jgi:hypothetical protein